MVFLIGILPTKERASNTMTMDIVSVFGPPAAIFFGTGGLGFLIGYSLKKNAKILAVVVGLFFIGLAYRDYNGMIKVNWDKVANSTNAAVQIGLNTTITIMNRTAIEVQHHATVVHSGVNEIGLFPNVGATGLVAILFHL
jgi:uncharacterized membrane protein (Fun14 family)